MLLLVLAILLLAWLRFGYVPSQSPAPLQESPSPSPKATTSSTQGWNTFETPFFTLSHPVEASTSATAGGPDSLSWSVVYLGDSQLEAEDLGPTELFDGFAVGIDQFTTVAELAALSQAESDRQATVDACGEDSATLVEETFFQSYLAYRYTGGCLGEATITYVQLGQYLYRISNMVVAPTLELEKIYNSSTDQITSSISFR
jgi:hypothetical protein